MKLVIDAGHGFHTPGKRSPNGMREYECNREVTRLLKEELSIFPGVDIRFSHSDERDVPLAERTALANRWDADLFLSIHANAYGETWNQANGIETYIDPSRPQEAQALATLIQERLIQRTGRKNRGVKTAPFYVLRKTKMTAVLIELGFMTHLEEAQLLRTSHYQQQCAEAIAEAIISYYQLEGRLTERTW
ncbi:N-acetylmuramoyl-L-alanine amidase [Bacillus sp. REN10]|uniref:N-acetylmuramoyl-L-alanine amidase n=1 Tax=Bacillus sp. REN10 TaxID=2782541 RepID=UPI00193C0F97|nr:N-acetylmuramoyl-L-alanine amidase [Bacillus sp. REN10]